MTKPVRNSTPKPQSSVKSTTRSADVKRIQVVVAKQKDGGVPKGSYVGRMQRVVAKRSDCAKEI